MPSRCYLQVRFPKWWLCCLSNLYRCGVVKLESAGAVFLPAAGVRDGSSVGNVQRVGYYWSATEYDSSSVYYLYFLSGVANMGGIPHYAGQSVRLVKDL